VGEVALPDERLEVLAKISQSKKIVPAQVTFVDIAGIVKGASAGAGLGNKFLSHIRESNAICQVVRVFKNGNITHVDETVDPKRDIETINTELILADLETLENAIPRYEKEVKAKRTDKKVLETALAAKKLLDDGKFLNQGFEFEPIRELALITTKTQIIVFNVDVETLKDEVEKARLKALVPDNACVFINAELEAELADLSKEDAKELLQSETGEEFSGLEQLARAGFEALGLQTFFTSGEKETRAWTIKKDSTAPAAAGVIHTDFEKGFIKAQVISYDDLVAYGSIAKVKAAGKVRLEGKDYIMQDSDIVEFRFNV
jgi:GTP-binding protein YchF